MKRLVSLLLVLMVLFSLTATAYATDDAGRAPDVTTEDYTYFYYTTGSLDIQNGIAYCGASASCVSSVNRINLSMYLQKYDNGWITIKYWTNRTNSDDASLNGQWAVMSGYAYRNRCFYYAYIGDVCVESAIMNCYDSY